MAKSYELEIGDYWRVIKRRKAVIVLCVALITGATYYRTSKIPPTYEALATIKIEKLASKIEESRLLWGTDFIETQLEVVHSQGVAREAALQAGLLKEGMTEQEEEALISQFQAVGTVRRGMTDIVDITSRSSDPERSAMVVNMVAQGYQVWSLKNRNEQARQVREFVEKQLKETEEKLLAKEEALKEFKVKSPVGAAISQFQSQLVTLELQLSDLLEQYTHMHPEVFKLEAQIAALKEKLQRYPELEMEYDQLTSEITNFKSIRAGLKQKYEDARTAEAESVSGVSILNRAKVPRAPIAPDVRRSTTLGAVIALIIGILLAFIRENLDTSISTIEQVEDLLETPVLGIIPEIIQEGSSGKRFLNLFPLKFLRRAKGKNELSTEDARKIVMFSGEEVQTSPSEAYKTLRTNLLFAVGKKKGQILELTSAGAGEGKSLTALNLSLTLAQSGHKTCLVLADLRRESICRVLGINREPGLADVLTKNIPWRDAIRRTSDLLFGDFPAERIMKTLGIDNFFLLTSGRLPLNPAELLSSEGVDNLFQELRSFFDFVIVDTPPALPVSDPSILAPKVDGVILVYQVGRTARGALKRAKVQIASTGAKVLGVILNNIKASEMKMVPIYYYYREYYGPEDQLIRERHRQKHPTSWWNRLFSRAA